MVEAVGIVPLTVDAQRWSTTSAQFSICFLGHTQAFVQHLHMHAVHWESFQQAELPDTFFWYVAESSEWTLTWDDLQFSLRKEKMFLELACRKQTSQTARLNE